MFFNDMKDIEKAWVLKRADWQGTSQLSLRWAVGAGAAS
jgi:hypothetical protein